MRTLSLPRVPLCPAMILGGIALCLALAGCSTPRTSEPRPTSNDSPPFSDVIHVASPGTVTESPNLSMERPMGTAHRGATVDRVAADPRPGMPAATSAPDDSSEAMPPMGSGPGSAMEPEMGMGHGEELPHPFLTHMGVPDPVGVTSVRLGATATRMDDGDTLGDASFHLETGLADRVGFHLRNEGVRNEQHTEAMFQFAAVRSCDGMSGFSPILEFEFPTRSGGDQRTNTLVGFSTALTGSTVAFNQYVHYDPHNDMFEGSASLVWRLSPRLFPVVEIGGEWGRDELPIVNGLLGLKYPVCENRYLGLAVEAPLTVREDYSTRLLLTFDFEF